MIQKNKCKQGQSVFQMNPLKPVHMDFTLNSNMRTWWLSPDSNKYLLNIVAPLLDCKFWVVKLTTIMLKSCMKHCTDPALTCIHNSTLLKEMTQTGKFTILPRSYTHALCRWNSAIKTKPFLAIKRHAEDKIHRVFSTYINNSLYTHQHNMHN